MNGGIIIGTFFYNIKRTVYKWWCVIYKPVYKLVHHGYWPREKEPYYIPEEEKSNKIDSPEAATSDAVAGPTADNSLGSGAVMPVDGSGTNMPVNGSGTDRDDSLKRADEILRRLEAEAAEDEAKKQAQIQEARKKAEEKQRLDAILKSTRVDISDYINQGIANRENENAENEALRKAQEIIDRLNREAAEDEAKKQAQIEAAKEYARNNNL